MKCRMYGARAASLAALSLSAMLLMPLAARAIELADPAAARDILPIEQVKDIRSQPLALLAKFPTAGPAMVRFIAQELLRDPTAVDAVLSIVPDTSPDQASAIGAGLVRAVRAMGASQSKLAELISQKVLRSENLWLKTTFAALGPAYKADRPLERPALALRSVYDAEEIGTPLANNKAPVGPSYEGFMFGREGAGPRGDGLQAGLVKYGTIVALLNSDAGKNGAVSTSPTN
jgi:hypothetical protein